MPADIAALFERRKQLSHRLQVVALLGMAGSVTAGLAGCAPGLVLTGFAGALLTWLATPLVLNRCPRCRRFLGMRMYEFGGWEPEVCPACGAVLGKRGCSSGDRFVHPGVRVPSESTPQARLASQPANQGLRQS